MHIYETMQGRIMHYNLTDNGNPEHTISEFNIISGDASGLRQQAETVEIDIQKYSYLKLGQKTQIVMTYKLTSPCGARLPKTAVFLITAALDGISISAADSQSVLLERCYMRGHNTPTAKINLCPDIKVLA